jgi:hypothetical protein
MKKTIVGLIFLIVVSRIYFSNSKKIITSHKVHHFGEQAGSRRSFNLIKNKKTLKINQQNPSNLNNDQSIADDEIIDFGIDFVKFDVEGNILITEVNIDGNKALIHGDIIISSLEDLKKKMSDSEYLKLPPAKLWSYGIVPYVISDDIPEPDRIIKAIDYLNQKTNVRFVKRNDHLDYIRFVRGDRNCYSYLGKQSDEQEITLSENCSAGTIMHELLHALGFLHEQNREDRDDYINIKWDNIVEEFKIQFKKIPNKFLNINDSPFDFNSIMLYPSLAFSINEDNLLFTMLTVDGEVFPGQKRVLSKEDVYRVNLLYKGEVDKRNNLSGNLE